MRRPSPPWIKSELQAAAQDSAAGRLDAAEARYQRILAAVPSDPEALANLGIVKFGKGKSDDAVRLLTKATRLEPGLAGAQMALGQILDRLGRLDAAIARYQVAADLMPADIDITFALADARRRMGDIGGACSAYGRILATVPNHEAARLGRAEVMLGLGDIVGAAADVDIALTGASPSALAHYMAGRVARAGWRLDQAIAHYREALALAPDFADAWYSLGNALLTAAAATEAATCYREALLRRPYDLTMRGNLLMCLQYQDPLSFDTWQDALAAVAAACPAPKRHTRRPTSPRKRVTVGYVSPDFQAHSCAWFLEPLLAAHDRTAIDIVCYAAVERPDALTQRFKKLADRWVDLRPLSDQEAAASIRRDHIDVLVDLAGHTGGGRLGLFAAKPAAVQVAWLGFPASTGIPTMDYRLTDRWLAPPDTKEPYSETLWRLDRVAHVYRPPADAPEVDRPPVIDAGRITFGSFNNFSKISARTLDLWAEVLRTVVGSRLRLKAKGVHDPYLCQRLLNAFTVRGIEADRIEFLPGAATTAEHLACYREIDIALDTFPYNGATTTLEALWMGVPVVSLSGDRAAARFGLSALAQIGLDDLATATPTEYVQRAAELAAAPDRLAALRAGLRATLAASPLLDAGDFGRAMERAYRAMLARTTDP